MAYFRPSLGQTPSSPTRQQPDYESVKDKRFDENSRPLVIFGNDISNWSPTLQYIILSGGLILFMCLYGYFQELVQYGWFDRKLSMFSTFLHFLGVSVFAQIQRNVSHKSNSKTDSNGNLSNSAGSGKLISLNLFNSVFSMGTAPPRMAFFYYVLLVIIKVIAQGMSNLCMTQINYPAKVLFKSANPIITMIIGVTWFRRSYPVRDYIVVVLLVVGLYVFIAADSNVTPTSTRLGILYVIISMFGSAGVPMIQEHVITVYNASVEDLLYHSFVGSTLVSLLLSLVSGELLQGLSFLLTNSSIHVWLIFISFCTFGFCGANFSTALTHQYGALVNGITNTFRKAITLTLSFVLFPDRNELSSGKLTGAAIFFLGLMVRVFNKGDQQPQLSHSKDKSDNNISSINSTNNSNSISGGSGGGGSGKHKELSGLAGKFTAVLNSSVGLGTVTVGGAVPEARSNSEMNLNLLTSGYNNDDQDEVMLLTLHDSDQNPPPSSHDSSASYNSAVDIELGATGSRQQVHESIHL